MFRITNEIAYRYLKDVQTEQLKRVSAGLMPFDSDLEPTRSKDMWFTKDFNVVDVFIEKNEPGVNEHTVIRCGYKEGNKTRYKNVHIGHSYIKDWIKKNRQNILDELLK